MLQNHKEEIKYKSKFSFRPFILFPFGAVGFGIAGNHLLDSVIGEEIDLFILLPAFFILFSIVCVIGLLVLKTIRTTPEGVIFTYIFLGIEKRIKWESISDVKMKFVTTKTDGDDVGFSTGSEVKMYIGKSSYELPSFFYSNFDEFLNQLNSRIEPSLRKKMNADYHREKTTFWKGEKEYDKMMWKYVLPIGLTIFIILYLLGVS